MSSIRPFFSPSNRAFHPEMSHCLLQSACTYKEAKDIDYLDILGSSSHLKKIGKCLPNQHLPVRTCEEIKEKLLRMRWRWERTSDLKKIEAALRDTPIVYDIPVVRFEPLEYQFMAEVVILLTIFS